VYVVACVFVLTTISHFLSIYQSSLHYYTHAHTLTTLHPAEVQRPSTAPLASVDASVAQSLDVYSQMLVQMVQQKLGQTQQQQQPQPQ
jgi:hypothetical protein